MHKLSVVSAVQAHANRLHGFVTSLVAQAGRPGHLEVVLVDDGSADDRSRAAIDACRRRYPQHVRCLPSCGEGRPAALNAALAAATGEWILFSDPSLPLAPGALRRLLAFLDSEAQPSTVLVRTDAAAAGAVREAGHAASQRHGACLLRIGQLEAAPAASGACFRRAALLEAGLRFDDRARPGFEDTLLMLRYLLAAGDDATVAWLAVGAAAASSAEPAAAVWALESTYGQAITAGHLEPLEQALRSRRAAPRWLQRAVLEDLQLYFSVDLRARAPTAVVSEAMAAVFHDLVGRVMRHIDVGAIERLDGRRVSVEVRHALLSYKAPQCHSAVALTAFDHDQGLVCASYYVHGASPGEAFLVDGRPVAAAYAKYRACRFFRRTLLRERIAWLPAAAARTLDVRLDGHGAALAVGPHAFTPARAPDRGAHGDPLPVARAAFPPGKAGGRQPRPAGLPVLSGLKARALRWLARRVRLRREFADAWVFVDRESEADDNAEHLYRWVRQHHPDINAWFLLSPSSSDWRRLAKEGFRLVAPGLRRKLLLLNSEHIVSSQPFYALGGFEPGLYGAAMKWRFTFLQHGVIKDDMSHWLSNQPFDIFVTSSPAEYESIAGDDTPYTYTARETQRTGLPRHDRLLQLAERMPPVDVDAIIVMPTWRGSLAAQADAQRADAAQFAAVFRESEYARSWRALLGDEALRQVAERHGKRLVFMPHPNAAPYLEAFDPPAHVQVVTKAEAGIQALFCRSAAMITDYSSVAFDMAYLRRPVVYYQFDRERFFHGDHNWREGYFQYDRDGFGPVARRHAEVACRLDDVLSGSGPPDYLYRMQQALPDRDGGACARVYEAMRRIKRQVAVREAEEPLATAPAFASVHRRTSPAGPARGGDLAADENRMKVPQ